MEHQPVEPDVPDAPPPTEPGKVPHPPLDEPPDRPPVTQRAAS